MWQSNNKSEISCILASLILNENNIQISDEKITTLLNNAGVKYENYWPRTFVRLSKNFDFEDISGFRKSCPVIDSKVSSPVNEKTEKKPNNLPSNSNKDSEDGDMGFGLFD